MAGPSTIGRAGCSTSSLLDLVLIALFFAFVYIYFVVSIALTDGPEQVYSDNLTQLLNARNLLLAVWAAGVWRTSTSPAWRKMLGVYAAGLSLTFVGGIVYDYAERTGPYTAGGLWDLACMVPYVVMAIAAAIAYDEQLFEPADEAPPLARLPVVSMIAITLLVAIPAIDEIARRLFAVSPQTESLRTRLALTMMIPFGMVVVVREFLSRRALIRAGQELVSTREQLVQKEKLAAVGQLVSGVAHELNNPLQGVLGYAELMLAARPSAAEAEELTRHSRQRQSRRRHRPQPVDLCRPHLVGARLAADQPRGPRRGGGARAAAAGVRTSTFASSSPIACRSCTSITRVSQDVLGQPDPERRERDRGAARTAAACRSAGPREAPAARSP